MVDEKDLWKYRDHYGNVVKLISIPGRRTYAGIKNDRIILLEINDKYRGTVARMAYPVVLQMAMWEAVYNVWEKPEKKAKYAKTFDELIHKKLQQDKMEFGQRYVTYICHNSRETSCCCCQFYKFYEIYM